MKSYYIKSYSDFERLWERRRGRKSITKALGYNETLRKTGDEFEFWYGSNKYAVMDPSGLTTLVYVPGFCDQTLFTRIYNNFGIRVVSWKQKHRLKMQSIRVICENVSWKNSLPLVKGLQFRKGRLLNPEIAVDYVRTIDRIKALEVKRAMRPLEKLTKVVARLELAEVTCTSECEINLEEPTMQDVNEVIALGRAHTNIPRTYSYWGMSPAEKAIADIQFEKDRRKRVISTGLRIIRERLYEQRGVYSYQPIHEEPERKAA